MIDVKTFSEVYAELRHRKIKTEQELEMLATLQKRMDSLIPAFGYPEIPSKWEPFSKKELIKLASQIRFLLCDHCKRTFTSDRNGEVKYCSGECREKASQKRRYLKGKSQ